MRTQPSVRADNRLRLQGRGEGKEGEGGWECMRPRGRPYPHGRWGASTQSPHVHADGFLPRPWTVKPVRG
jgi:hypothetical protein